MYEYQCIKECWNGYLLRTNFKSRTFKEIKEGFLFVFPQFREKSLYNKIYRAFRDAEANGLVIVSSTIPPYKYNSAMYVQN